MTKMLVYSHDTYGLGNIRRMLAICTHMADVSPDLSILLVTGSPLIHGFRLPPRLDYIKLPCLTRIDRESYRTKHLGIDLDVTLQLRSGLILNAVDAFRPDLVMVDKKPLGIKSELKAALAHLKRNHRHARTVLVLRDIIDSAEATIRTWRTKGYYDAIYRFYDRVAVLGCPEVFDFRREYHLPESLVQRTHFCGYVRREPGRRDPAEIRKELNLRDGGPFVLVTAGGGEDSSRLMETYLAAVPCLDRLVPGLTSLLIHGPELPETGKRKLRELTRARPNVVLRDFTDDPMSYMAAADVVVSMGGYNTVCEILTLGKPAIVVPRVRPVEEQWIRAQRMEKLGLFRAIHPDVLTPEVLAHGVASELASPRAAAAMPWVDLNALERIAEILSGLRADGLRAAGTAARPAARFRNPGVRNGRATAGVR